MTRDELEIVLDNWIAPYLDRIEHKLDKLIEILTIKTK